MTIPRIDYKGKGEAQMKEMKVGSLVREVMEGTIGVIVRWGRNGHGAVVFFPKHNCEFFMEPQTLEVLA